MQISQEHWVPKERFLELYPIPEDYNAIEPNWMEVLLLAGVSGLRVFWGGKYVDYGPEQADKLVQLKQERDKLVSIRGLFVEMARGGVQPEQAWYLANMVLPSLD